MTDPHFEFDNESVTFVFENGVKVTIYQHPRDGLGDVFAEDERGRYFDFLYWEFRPASSDAYNKELMNAEEIVRFLGQIS